ncbi:amidohydrolase family protein [Streptomyces sp. NPDC001508]|uniref:amidohydrolase family protein n=1 Tax=Streptomyces sp. NPDC001508 TaxID=3154656 RepID=UPI00331C7810
MNAHPTRLIDVHAHFLTPRYIEEAKAAGHVRPDGMPSWPTWDAARHLDLMDEWGVATSLLSISSPGTHFGDDAAARALSRHVNETGAEVKHQHPSRFGHFASLPLPDVDAALDELAYAMDELSSDGVVLTTNADGIYLGDPRFAPLLAELDRRRTPTFVHPTSPPHFDAVSLGRPRSILEFIFDTTRTVSDLVFNGRLQQYPDIPWIFTHGAGALPLLAPRMEMFRSVLSADDATPPGNSAQPSVLEEVSSLWFDIAGTPFPHQVPALTSAFGTERILYGSDHCFTPAAATAAQLASIDAAPQPENDTWLRLTTRNAYRLFPHLTETVGNPPRNS